MPRSSKATAGAEPLLKGSQGVTMETIARLAGVSQVTVSRALNHPGKVSPETLSRITEAIDLTGYVPNLVAGALASRKSRLIAALVPSMTNVVYAEMVQNFIALIRTEGYQILFGETGFSEEEEQKLVQAVLSRRPDGILLTGVHHSPECRRMLLGAGIPVVELWEATETPIDICVGFSHSEAGAAVGEFVISKGYRRLAAVTANDERAIRRKDAFCRAVEAKGFDTPISIVIEGDASIGRGRKALSDLLEQGFGQGVITCSSDLLASGILIEAQSRGLGVPGEIAVVGFGDQTFAADTHPPLTSVRVDRSLLGRKAADALLARLRGQDVASRKVDVGFSIVTRGTA